uniref:Calmodulin-lysine N-methyltransferase n=1 Tax=Eptatretus burgeri TaxID=7764 RepID=A0A8C4QX18_EPTBU
METGEDEASKRTRARLAAKRWNILRLALQRGKLPQSGEESASVRSFAAFGVFWVLPAGEPGGSWWIYRSSLCTEAAVLVKLPTGQLQLNEILHSFDNTGNICVWPAEEVMTHYLIKHRNVFSSLSICELGGGSTCLAGLMLAVSSEAKQVLLTDGNERAVANINEMLKRNRMAGFLHNEGTSCRVLRWDKKDDVLGLQGQFDIVLCADCLFLDDYRACLVQTIDDLLKPCGTALVFSPRRGKTLELFCELAQCYKFCIEKTQIYDEEVWEKHCKLQANGEKIYDEDLHYPYMLTLRKATSCNIEETAQ